MKDLKLSLIVEALDRATGPLRKIGASLRGLEERAGSLGKSFRSLELPSLLGGGLAAGAAVAAGAGLFELTKHVAELGEHAELTAQKTGLSTTEIQRLEYASTMASVATESLDTATRMFAMHVAAAARGSKAEVRSLAEFGVSIKDASGHLKPMGELIREVSEAFKAMPDGFIKTDAAMKLFGRSGADIIPLLNKGRLEIESWGDAAQKMGLIIDEVGVDKSVLFERALKSMNGAIEGMKIKIGLDLMPVMTQLTEKLASVAMNMQPQVLKNFSDAMGKLIAQAPGLIGAFSQIVDGIATLIPKVLKVTDAFGGLKSVVLVLAGVMALEFAGSIAGSVTALWGLAGALNLAKAAAGVAFLWDLIAGFVALAPAGELATAAMLSFDAAMDANPIGLMVLAIEALVALAGVVIANWAPLSKWWSGFWDGLVKTFSDGWRRLWSGIPDWARKLLKLGAIGVAITNPALAVAGASMMPAPAHPTVNRRPLKPPAAAAHHSQVSGKIVIEAAPGTVVRKMSSSSNLVLQSNRGPVQG